MGSFVGHIDESVFFLILAFWWMFNHFPRYIRSQWNKTEYRCRVSFPLPTKRYVPLEAYLKTIFPVAGLIGEIFSEGVALTDAEGHFRKLAQLQHMSIYGIFIVHGLIDIMMSHGVPLPQGLDYLSAVAAISWYGLSFSFHAHMHGKEMVEQTIHVMPISVMYVTAIAGVTELLNPGLFVAAVVRIFGFLFLGTWFCQASFVMYVPYPWPGSNLNPKWDQMDERNVNFIVASFGYHMILNIVIVTVVYLVCYAYLRFKGEGRSQFRRLTTGGDCPEENGVQFKPLLNGSNSGFEGH